MTKEFRPLSSSIEFLQCLDFTMPVVTLFIFFISIESVSNHVRKHLIEH